MKPKNPKKFDCIAFKRQVQSEMYEETRGMNTEEYLEYLRRRVEEGPFAEWWKANGPARPVGRTAGQ
jgi:hypothetical protein